jgi:hypothetical protein
MWKKPLYQVNVLVSLDSLAISPMVTSATAILLVKLSILPLALVLAHVLHHSPLISTLASVLLVIPPAPPAPLVPLPITASHVIPPPTILLLFLVNVSKVAPLANTLLITLFVPHATHSAPPAMVPLIVSVSLATPMPPSSQLSTTVDSTVPPINTMIIRCARVALLSVSLVMVPPSMIVSHVLPSLTLTTPPSSTVNSTVPPINTTHSILPLEHNRVDLVILLVILVVVLLTLIVSCVLLLECST